MTYTTTDATARRPRRVMARVSAVVGLLTVPLVGGQAAQAAGLAQVSQPAAVASTAPASALPHGWDCWPRPGRPDLLQPAVCRPFPCLPVFRVDPVEKFPGRIWCPSPSPWPRPIPVSEM